ncbi:LacI family transcriptional regulator [Pontibacter qinzhouensis]|uniref:LacI family transcriptional regulator n=1 Tax=Pontibacter qinzhouensis TaxID=2603253 RepID=A0A5C8JKW1_9BACT|nr:LacI family DNA-binding transcriptional regulator [Pontibacter qinzhouensis]TXK37324.1 LacI family transcriptional regulator [Pontibacter qinzhouensis]
MEKINIKSLAEELNLSISTVSRALHDSYEISAETKKRVVELATKLNYVPNHHASSLRSKKSKMIAVVIPEVADSFFAQAINGIESVAQENGYHVLIYLTHESLQKEQAILKDFQCGRVDGVLMSVSAETTGALHIKELMAKGIPLVFFDRASDEVETARITTDDLKSSYAATQHLLESGCQKIALLSVSDSLSISNERMAGYKQALLDHHLSFNTADIVLCTNNEEQNLQRMISLLQNSNRPDGIIATVEKLTTSVYLACHSLQLSIPNHVKVISFSNLQSALLLNPSLTTITQPAFEMGRSAATLIFKSLKNKNFNLKGERLVIPSRLDIRSSTVT